MKSEIYNLIILDESGSMSGVKNATISGCNETLNTIRAAQERFGDKQDQFVSIYVFQSNDKVPSRYLIKNQPIGSVANINGEQYEPWGCTPLYDAIGATLADLKAVTKDKELAVGNVTIITDGMENSSTHYTHEKVAKMIDALKEIGWSFNFIGANIDVEGTAQSLNIDNALEFSQDELGIQKMFCRERQSRMNWYNRTNKAMEEVASMDVSESTEAEVRESRLSKLRKAAKSYFKKDDE